MEFQYATLNASESGITNILVLFLSCENRLLKHASVQCPVLDGLGDVVGADFFGGFKVGYGAGDF